MGSPSRARRLVRESWEDCRLDRRRLRQATKFRIPGPGARNDRSAVQEAAEPTHCRTTANVGVWHRLCARQDQFSWSPLFLFSTHDDRRTVWRVRSRREHRPCQGARHRKGGWDPTFDPQWTLPSLAEKNPLVWMAEVNGLLLDLRNMPGEVQEIAFENALIPFIPAARKDRS
jgi:hypothetical protein